MRPGKKGPRIAFNTVFSDRIATEKLDEEPSDERRTANGNLVEILPHKTKPVHDGLTIGSHDKRSDRERANGVPNCSETHEDNLGAHDVRDTPLNHIDKTTFSKAALLSKSMEKSGEVRLPRAISGIENSKRERTTRTPRCLLKTEAENNADRYEKYKSVKASPLLNAPSCEASRDIGVGPTVCEIYKNILR